MPSASSFRILYNRLLWGHRALLNIQQLGFRRAPFGALERFGTRSYLTQPRIAFRSSTGGKHTRFGFRHPLQRTRRIPKAQHRCQSNQPHGARPTPDPTAQLGSPSSTPAPSLSERLRKLSREYGWTALGVYLALSALDFPFCFLAVRMLGTDRIGKLEEQVIHGFWVLVSLPFPGGEDQARSMFKRGGSAVQEGLQAIGLRQPKSEQRIDAQAVTMSQQVRTEDHLATEEDKWTWGVEEAQAANKDRACMLNLIFSNSRRPLC